MTRRSLRRLVRATADLAQRKVVVRSVDEQGNPAVVRKQDQAVAVQYDQGSLAVGKLIQSVVDRAFDELLNTALRAREFSPDSLSLIDSKVGRELRSASNSLPTAPMFSCEK